MCLIIDANRLGDFLTKPEGEDVQPIYDWLGRGGKIVYSTGGKFAGEIVGRALDALDELHSSGRAMKILDEELEAEVGQIGDRIRSDDPHVLALARASGARVLYTGDRKLIDDFTDSDIIKRPRGKVYSGAGNSDLLQRANCTGRLP